jgi:NAD(P)-dependent dehydrogenase (short-subunit alcohol dehydrogenase family)
MAANTEQLMSTRVLVTGGTTGLGRAMAAALAASGARVVLTSRDRARAQAAAAEIGAIGIELDVRYEASVQAGVAKVYERLEGLDVLVSNAGIGMRSVNPRFMTDPQPFWEVSPDGFRDVVETKITGSFLVARAVAPRMVQAGGGRIVVISMNEQTMTRRGFVRHGCWIRTSWDRRLCGSAPSGPPASTTSGSSRPSSPAEAASGGRQLPVGVGGIGWPNATSLTGSASAGRSSLLTTRSR